EGCRGERRSRGASRDRGGGERIRSSDISNSSIIERFCLAPPRLRVVNVLDRDGLYTIEMRVPLMPPNPGWGHPGGADGWATLEVRLVEHAPRAAPAWSIPAVSSASCRGPVPRIVNPRFPCGENPESNSGVGTKRLYSFVIHL